MNFTRKGVPTHPSFQEAWEHRKLAIVTKPIQVKATVGGRIQIRTVYPQEVVWALLYVSMDKPRYLIQSPRLQMNVTVAEDAIQIVKEGQLVEQSKQLDSRD